MTLRSLLAFCLGGIALAACGPQVAGPLTVGVLGPGATPGSYAIIPTPLDDLESLRALRGPGVEVLAGAKIIFDHDALEKGINEGEIRTLEDIRESVLRRQGKAPNAAFTLGSLGGQDSVWLAEDFHSLGMATAYAHVSRARAAALAAGLPPTCLARLPLYYDVTFIERSGGVGGKQADNAFFMPLMGSIFFLPYEDFPTLSMAMNQGIIAHEYSHGIWACQVEDFEPFPWRALSLDGPSSARISAYNEGVADYFAAWVTGDPNFLAVSLPVLSAARDTSVVRLYTQAMADDAENGGDYNPYAMGAVLASALWRVREETTDSAVADRWVVRALAAMPAALDAAIAGGGRFTLAEFLAVLVRSADQVDQVFHTRACRVLSERFTLAGTISGCP